MNEQNRCVSGSKKTCSEGVYRLDVFFKLLIGHQYLHMECEYHTTKKQAFYFLDRSHFFPKMLRCKQKHHPFTIAVWNRSTKTADKLIICVSQQQVWLDKQDQIIKTTILKTKYGKVELISNCSVFSDDRHPKMCPEPAMFQFSYEKARLAVYTHCVYSFIS